MFQVLFTLIFGIYSFWFLVEFKSVIPSILLHCYCNFLGPPSINKQNLRWHCLSILSLVAYCTFVIWETLWYWIKMNEYQVISYFLIFNAWFPFYYAIIVYSIIVFMFYRHLLVHFYCLLLFPYFKIIVFINLNADD